MSLNTLFLLGCGFLWGACFIWALLTYFKRPTRKCLSITSDEGSQILLSFFNRLMEGLCDGRTSNQWYEIILHESVISTEATCACFYAYESETKQLKTFAQEGLFPLLKTETPTKDSRTHMLAQVRKGETWDLEEGIMQYLYQTRQTVILNGLKLENYVLQTDDEALKLHSLLFCPIFFQDEFFGVLAVANSLKGEAFSLDAYHRLQTVGKWAGIALESARVFYLKMERNRIHFHLKMAQQVQQFLLPQLDTLSLDPNRFASYYQPAQQIGGDFYDILKIDTHRTAFVVADVAGKGISASLLMATCRTHLKHCKNLYDKPAEVLKTINHYLYAETNSKMLVTMVYCLLDRNQGTLTLARAGHEYPIFVKKDASIEKLITRGMSLGIPDDMFNTHIEEKIYTFNLGDLCLLYTDGVTEALNAKNEEFSQEKLFNSLNEVHNQSPKFVVQSLANAVQNWTQGKFSDDITLLAFN